MTNSVGVWQALHADLDRLDRDLLLADALQITRAQVIARPERELDSATQHLLNSQAQRLREGYPMAYLRGFKEFWGREFSVDERVLIPRPETEHLVEQALQCLAPGDRVLDLGTGSGVIAITVALECPDVDVSACDISEEALSVAEQNLRKHKASVRLFQSHWLNGVNEPFDVILSNPPYVGCDDPALDLLQAEPVQALVSGSDGLNALRELIKAAKPWCRRTLIVEHGADQGADVRRLMTKEGYLRCATHADLAGLDRITIGWCL